MKETESIKQKLEETIENTQKITKKLDSIKGKCEKINKEMSNKDENYKK